MLYSRPLSCGVDYFINNLKDNKKSLTAKNAGGFIKQKETSEIQEIEKGLLGGKDFETLSYEWAFGISKPNYQEQEGVPIIRIMGQLSPIDKVGGITN